MVFDYYSELKEAARKRLILRVRLIHEMVIWQSRPKIFLSLALYISQDRNSKGKLWFFDHVKLLESMSTRNFENDPQPEKESAYFWR